MQKSLTLARFGKFSDLRKRERLDDDFVSFYESHEDSISGFLRKFKRTKVDGTLSFRLKSRVAGTY